MSGWSRVDTRWYLGVRCEKCQLPILFGLDHSSGSVDAERRPAGRLVLTCTLETCRHRADYSTSTILRYKKDPAGAALSS